jgi:tetratricopeptide (TPR) repeat protein
LRSRDVLGAEQAGDLDVAGFLDGFEITDAPEFTLWKDRQQAGLLPFIREGLKLLIERCRRTGEFAQIGHLADRLLAIDDLSEEGMRAKLETRALAGDRLIALRMFEVWKEKLRRELAAFPSAEIEDIAARLRRGGWERTTIADMPILPPEPGRDRPFIGRSHQYEELYGLWEDLKGGRQTHSILIGDSGVGKTTLVERLTSAASLEGAAVARVQSYDLERSIPFATLGGLTLRLLDASGSSATSAESLSELARAIPDVRRRFPNLPLAIDSRGETARLRLTEAFQELLTSVADEHPVILVIDDLHLADEASLAVLHLVLRRVTHLRVMAILTARPGELARSSEGTLVRNNLTRAGARDILLPPLNGPATRELLSALLAQDTQKPSAMAQRAIAQASGGYPMVLELLVQDWRTNGSGSAAIGLDAMTLEFTGGVGLAEAYSRIFPRLSEGLEPATRNALDVASILGFRLNDLTLYSIADLSLGQTMAALGQLSELRVFRESEKGIEFTNELIRAHVYAAIPSPVRRALHASVADRLLHSECHRTPGVGLEIAWHCMRAGRTEEAIPHLLSGATEAIRGGAPQSAELALMTALPSLQGDDQVSAQILLVEALQEQGRWRDSLEVLETLRGIESRSQETFALVALAKGYLGLPTTEWLAFLPSLKEIMNTGRSTQDRIRAARAVAHATSQLRNRELAFEMLDALGEINVSDQDVDARSHIGLARALLLYQAGRIESSYHLASSLLEDLRARGVANSIALRLQIGLGAIRGRQGRYLEASIRHENTLREAILLGNDTLTTQVRVNLALCYGRLGRYSDQLACASSGPKAGPDDPMTFTDVQLASSLALPHAAEGRLGQMRAAIDDCDRRLNHGVDAYITQSWFLWKADILAIAGLFEEALRVGTHSIFDYDMKLECTAMAGTFARWLAIASVEPSFHSRASEILVDMRKHLDDYDALDQVEILCASLQHGCDEIERHLEELHSRLSFLPETALVPLRACGIPVGF